jgi:rod shape-determining protein MreC
VYPPGLAVATVVKVDRKVESGFARISLQANARPDGVRHVLVLDPLSTQMPPRPQPEVDTTAKTPRQRGSRR